MLTVLVPEKPVLNLVANHVFLFMFSCEIPVVSYSALELKTPWVIVTLMGWADREQIKREVPGSFGVGRDCTMF